MPTNDTANQHRVKSQWLGGRQAAPYTSAVKKLFPMLNDREREGLALIAKGATNDNIAQQLIVTHKTVSNYVLSILSKLHVADRAQAVIRAREAGLS